MEKIFWLGEPYFAPDLEACGWQEVFIHSPKNPQTYNWTDLVKLAGFVPDLVLLAPSEHSGYLQNVEDFPCLTILYAAEGRPQLHLANYAQAFDACLISQSDHLFDYAGPFMPKERLWWSAPFAPNDLLPMPEAQARADCLFVGSINPETKPKRAAFLAKLKKDFPELLITEGNCRELFPQGKIILNYAEYGELNFKVFEAMALGKCLLTPRINNGLEKLFVDGEEMVAYAPDDVGDAIYRIKFLLENPDLIEYIGQTAAEKIASCHRSIHRAQAFTDHICDLTLDDPSMLIRKRQNNAEKIRSLGLNISQG